MGKYPFIKLVVYFCIGLILSPFVNLTFIIGAIIFLLILYIILKLLKIEHPACLFIVPLLIIFTASAYRNISASHIEYPFEFTRIKDADIYGRIEQIDLPDSSGTKFIVDTDSVKFNGEMWYIGQSFLCNIRTDITDNIKVSQRVKIRGRIDKPRNRRNPGEFDYQQYLLKNGITALVRIKRERDVEIIDDSYNLFLQTLLDTRLVINEKISFLHLTNTTALLRGLILADRSLIEESVKEQYINAGIVHILAVSGLHVGFVLLIFLFVFGRFNLYAKTIFTILGIALFYLITAGQPSVFRASVMAVIFLLCFLLNRNYNSFNVLAIAAFIILVINPDEIDNAGFQLSFSAVLSILIFTPLFQSWIKGKKIKFRAIENILLFASVSLAAQIGTLPFTLFYFNKLSIISLFSNIIAIPLAGMIVSTGILTLAISPLSIYFASVYAELNNLLVLILNKAAELFTNTSVSHFDVYRFSVFDGIIFYLLILLLVFILKRYRGLVRTSAMCSLVIVLFYFTIQFDNKEFFQPNKLYIVFIDVGQGDATFIKFPNGKTALIDAGDRTEYFDNGKRIVKPLLNRFGVDRINYGFITHMDHDHCGGYFYLIEAGMVDTLIKPIITEQTKEEEELLHLLEKAQLPIKYFHESVMKVGNVNLYLLNDTTNTVYRSFERNNLSGILKLVYGNQSVLFTGDAEKEAEDVLVENYGNFLKADIYKAGHHGSKTSSGDRLLNLVRPKLSVISCGVNNKFNHPSKEVIDKFNRRGILTKRTDNEGAIILEMDGDSFNFIDWGF